MPGSLNLYDQVWLTADSESSPRGSTVVDTLQIHHTAYPNLAGSRALMDPGGRTVSANGLLAPDGTLYEVVPLNRRAFTSASRFDYRCLTEETVNESGAPEWRIPVASRERLAELAVAMLRAGILKGLYRGAGGIIGHYEVPGTYPTACPGPDMNLDWINSRAVQLYTTPTTLKPSWEDTDMYIKGTTYPTVYCAYTDVEGNLRLRVVSPAEAAYATKGGRIVEGDDATLTALAKAAGYEYQKGNPNPVRELLTKHP